jgi:hypothetical protein
MLHHTTSADSSDELIMAVPCPETVFGQSVVKKDIPVSLRLSALIWLLVIRDDTFFEEKKTRISGARFNLGFNFLVKI